jgi:hypothetical protein
MKGKVKVPPTLLFGIGLLTLGAVIFEVSLSRVFSVSQGYYFAFLVVSIALLGIGAAGSFLMMKTPSSSRANPSRVLMNTAFLFSLTSLLSYAVINTIPFDLERIAVDPRQPLFLLLAYFLLAIPFLFSGCAVAFLLWHSPTSAGRIYCADLLGAGAGGTLSLLFLSIGGGMGGVIMASLSGALSCACVSRRKALPLGWALVLLILFFVPPGTLSVTMSPYKELNLALHYPGATHKTFYNAISRLDVVVSGAVRTAPGLSLTYPRELPPQVGITTDGGNLVAVTGGNPDSEGWEFVEYLPSSLPYIMKEQKKVLILSLGGGMDVGQALRFGAEEITIIEPNPLMVSVFESDLDRFTDGLLRRDEIIVRIGSPREVLARTDERFDVIVISGLSTFGASGTGTGTIGENYDLTAEAFSLYLSHLEPNGFITATRYLIPPPREELRLFATATSALKSAGLEPARCSAVLRSWGTITYLFKRGTITDDDIHTLREFAREQNFDTAYFPGITESDINIYNRFPQPIYENALEKILSDTERDAFFEHYLFDVRPTTDEKPFHSLFFKYDRIVETYRAVEGKWPILLEGGYLVWVVFFEGIMLSLVLIILPVAFRKKAIRPGDLLILYPFLAFGLAFMFLEISLIKRFILFLGQPVISVSAVITAILISAGLGSFASGTGARNHPKKTLALSLVILSLVIVLYRIGTSWVLASLISLPLAIKYILSAVIIFPLGFAMGFPFPSAMRYLGETENASLIPWAWCVNGTASVVGAPLAVMCALSLGFPPVMTISAFLYLSGLSFLIKR